MSDFIGDGQDITQHCESCFELQVRIDVLREICDVKDPQQHFEQIMIANRDLRARLDEATRKGQELCQQNGELLMKLDALQWISVEELPEERGYYHATDGTRNGTHVLWFSDCGLWRLGEYHKTFNITQITHWKPITLPPLPNPEEGSEE